ANPNFPGVSSRAAGTRARQTGSPNGRESGSERVKRPRDNAKIVGRSPRRTPTQTLQQQTRRQSNCLQQAKESHPNNNCKNISPLLKFLTFFETLARRSRIGR